MQKGIKVELCLANCTACSIRYDTYIKVQMYQAGGCCGIVYTVCLFNHNFWWFPGLVYYKLWFKMSLTDVVCLHLLFCTIQYQRINYSKECHCHIHPLVNISILRPIGGLCTEYHEHICPNTDQATFFTHLTCHLSPYLTSPTLMGDTSTVWLTCTWTDPTRRCKTPRQCARPGLLAPAGSTGDWLAPGEPCNLITKTISTSRPYMRSMFDYINFYAQQMYKA